MNDDKSAGVITFDDFGQDNGVRYWYAHDLMVFLGYSDSRTFFKAINKAMAACAALDIKIPDEFESVKRILDGHEVDDYKLSRFACYLTAMNADSRKPRVAEAQAYFAGLAEAFRQYVESAEAVERVLIRDKISEQVKTLDGIAHSAGVENFPFFINAGYRGMYNMNISQIREYKGIHSKKGKSLLDFMGKRELAANLFRITETEAEIVHNRVRGQQRLETTAESVGRRVRNTMYKADGVYPEDLPASHDIAKVRKELKQTKREFKKIDKPKGGRQKKAEDE